MGLGSVSPSSKLPNRKWMILDVPYLHKIPLRLGVKIWANYLFLWGESKLMDS
jgi:hypothetical protein